MAHRGSGGVAGRPDPSPPGRAGLGSRALVIGLVVAAAILAVLPGVIARSRRLQTMRADLSEVLAECRDRYAAARTAADTESVDRWQPALHGVRRAGDPACGRYRRRDMIR